MLPLNEYFFPLKNGSGKEEQQKTVMLTENGTSEITPDEGKTLSKVTIDVNVPIPPLYDGSSEDIESEVSV